MNRTKESISRARIRVSWAQKMAPKMMEKFFSDVKPEDMEKMMGMMHDMMERSFADMEAGDIESMMRDMRPKMMDGCFSKMSAEQRQGMLSMCRGMLDQIEETYTPEVTGVES